MKRIWLLIFAICIGEFRGFCQNAQSNLNEIFYENCALVTYSKNGTDFASSGFIVFNPIDIKANRGNIYLITTKHTLPVEGEFNAIKIRFFRKDFNNTKARMELTVVLTDKKGRYLPKIQMNRNGADIAAINITEEFVNDQINDKGIPTNLLISKDKLKTEGFTVGDEIYTIGYPDGIYDEKNYSPIFRFGIISTLPYLNYVFNAKIQKKVKIKSLDGFLIDANVYPGSSGSLVIFKTLNNSLSGVSFGGSKATPYILGIISDSIPFEDTFPNNVQRMGIGIVYSSEAILNTILFGTRLANE